MQHINGSVPSILVVDDSVETLQIVSYALQKAGFSVSTAVGGEQALEVLTERGLPHLIVVDLNMPPGMDGFEVCRRVHKWSDVPIIMLTVVDEVETIVEALDQYVEDYVMKPFNPKELVARVRRVLRRIGLFPHPMALPVNVDGHLKVNFPGREVVIGGAQTTITPTEARLLYLLMRNTGETVLADYLLRRMWPREIVFEDRLHVYVHRLRRKLATKKHQHQYIVAERGLGYLFNPMSIPNYHTVPA